jgi:hypothetical protein
MREKTLTQCGIVNNDWQRCYAEPERGANGHDID